MVLRIVGNDLTEGEGMSGREIRFRAWVEADKILPPGPFRGTMVCWEMLNPLLKTDDPRIHIMQYTGLHDRTGKEIYEGDILDASFPGNFKSIVTYFAPEFRMVSIKSGQPWDFNSSVTVIGNIYENPELLHE